MSIDIHKLRTMCELCLLNKSVRYVAHLNNCSPSTVVRLKARLKLSSIFSLESLNKLSDSELSKRLYSSNTSGVNSQREVELLDKHIVIHRKNKEKENILIPDFDKIIDSCVKLKTSIQTAYVDYLEECNRQDKTPYSRTHFYRCFKNKVKAYKDPVVTMYQFHPYGEAVQLDLAGETLTLNQPDGSVRKHYILVMTWPASYYTFATLIPDMTTKSFCEGIIKGLQYFQCKPEFLVIDNAKALVTKHHVGADEVFNEEFSFFMHKIGILIDANNPRSPTEKHAVERMVGIICDRCLSRLKRQSFLTVEEYSSNLLLLTEQYINKAPFRKQGEQSTTRETLFLSYEKTKALPLPEVLPSYIKYYPNLKVASNYLVQVEGKFYSVPYQYVGKTIDAELSGNEITFYYDLKPIASHTKNISDIPLILPEHAPKNHLAVIRKRNMYNTPNDILQEAKSHSKVLYELCASWLEHDGMQKKKVCICCINFYKRY